MSILSIELPAIGCHINLACYSNQLHSSQDIMSRLSFDFFLSWCSEWTKTSFPSQCCRSWDSSSAWLSFDTSSLISTKLQLWILSEALRVMGGVPLLMNTNSLVELTVPATAVVLPGTRPAAAGGFPLSPSDGAFS